LPAVHALPSGRVGDLLDGQFKGNRQPPERVRVRDAPLLDLVDRLPGGAGVAALIVGGIVHAPGDRGKRQAQPSPLLSHEFGQGKSVLHAARPPPLQYRHGTAPLVRIRVVVSSSHPTSCRLLLPPAFTVR
jgi:hypothetical protein